jgi:1-phosphofructokinase family hexose kinase
VIVTVTLNAALDITYEAPRIAWGEVNRVEAVHARAGGKGINVARTLRQLGHEAVVTGLAGGHTGAAIRTELRAAGMTDRLLPMGCESRRTVTAVSREDGAVTALNEHGPAVSEDEWRRFADAFASFLPGADAVVLSGSLPRGIPDGAYAELATACAHYGVPAFVDASGQALLAALGAAPALVKPNREEIAAVLGEPPADHAGALRAAAELRGRGAEAVVVSLGEDGLCAHTPEGAWRATAPRVGGNPVGAGDAVVAALAAGFVEGRSWPERLRSAAATGAAAVAEPAAGGYDEPTRARLIDAVVVERA